MPLPLVGALPAIISAIGTAISFIIKFFKDKLIWVLTKLPSFLAISFVNGVMLSLFISYVYLAIKILLVSYGLIDQFFGYLSFKNTNSEVGNLARNILSSSLFFEALRDVLNIFKPIVSSAFVGFASLIGVKAFKAFRTSLLSLVIAKI
ncbi:hypothetical protein CUREO4125_08005 [Campylobacter ureolyticus]|uniref:hypothetical protein n=1 Tax=Campylobacter ureolyticus TaxID=827 RepID=UPI00215A6B90|nr:hypothetical protein [Campylobacter ureolyticus]MCR8700320.1 hypothetical protein [Campylobacter ureolyticus]